LAAFSPPNSNYNRHNVTERNRLQLDLGKFKDAHLDIFYKKPPF